jgi:hypothetical protein
MLEPLGERRKTDLTQRAVAIVLDQLNHPDGYSDPGESEIAKYFDTTHEELFDMLIGMDNLALSLLNKLEGLGHDPYAVLQTIALQAEPPPK